MGNVGPPQGHSTARCLRPRLQVLGANLKDSSVLRTSAVCLLQKGILFMVILITTLEASTFGPANPGASVGKESTYNAGAEGEVGLIPGSGRSPGGGNGSPLQYA